MKYHTLSFSLFLFIALHIQAGCIELHRSARSFDASSQAFEKKNPDSLHVESGNDGSILLESNHSSDEPSVVFEAEPQVEERAETFVEPLPEEQAETFAESLPEEAYLKYQGHSFKPIKLTRLGCPPRLIPASHSILEKTIKKSYLWDANRISIRLLYSIAGGNDHTQIELPNCLYLSIYRGLAKVHLSRGWARNQVVSRYHIHTYPRPNAKVIVVSAKCDSPTMKAWKKKQLITGVTKIDSLIKKYGLQIKYKGASHSKYCFVDVIAPTQVNSVALIKWFSKQKGFYGQGGGEGGFGDDIKVQILKEGILFVYRVGYGDCPMGCIYKYKFYFFVSYSGKLQFLGTTGSPPKDR